MSGQVSEEGDVTDLYDDAAQLHHEPIPARRAVTLHVHDVLVRALAKKDERTYNVTHAVSAQEIWR